MESFISKHIVKIVLALEVVLGGLILKFVPYTEIDWVAYMQQVETFLSGDLNYYNYKGDTGPCVYGGGYLYVFSLLYKLTENGKNIFKAQVIFYVLYLFETWVVMQIYLLAIKRDNKDRRLSMHECFYFLLLAASRRLHSIFMLRCFNDCFAVAFTYLSIWCLMKNKVFPCLVLFSIGISIKMSALLYLPALLMNLNFHFGIVKTLVCLVLLVIMQVVIGLEWILAYPQAYFGKAFEFDRVFFFIWSVNWQFLGEETATGKDFAKLLIIHSQIILKYHYLLVFLFFKWTSITRGLGNWINKIRLNDLFGPKSRSLDPRYVALSMFTCNLIGILCARSLHYQFYSWYYQTLPLILLYIRGIPFAFKIMIIGVIEVCWNLFPPRDHVYASIALFACHVILVLSSLVLSKYPSSPYLETAKQPTPSKLKKVQ